MGEAEEPEVAEASMEEEREVVVSTAVDRPLAALTADSQDRTGLDPLARAHTRAAAGTALPVE